MKEGDIQRAIMIALSADGHAVFRGNVGMFWTKDGRPIKSGLPVGFSDLFGHRRQDCRAFYFEVKTAKGRPRPEQSAFLAAMRSRGAIADVVRSAQEALELLNN